MLLIEPLDFALLSCWCQILLFVMGGYLFAEGTLNLLGVGSYGVVRFAQYRLMTGDRIQNSSALTSFTLSYRGCQIAQRTMSYPEPNAGSSFAVDFPGPVAMDGFLLHVANSSARPGPFRLEGSADGGATWRLVGAPNHRLTRRGVRLLAGDGADPARTDFDHRPSWAVCVACGSRLVLGLALCVAAATGALAAALERRTFRFGGGDVLRRLYLPRWAAAAAAVLAGLEACRLGRAEQRRDAFLPGAMCAIWCGTGACFLLAGRRLPLRLAAAAAAAVAVRVGDDLTRLPRIL
jgi:hypothetical protein